MKIRSFKFLMPDDMSPHDIMAVLDAGFRTHLFFEGSKPVKYKIGETVDYLGTDLLINIEKDETDD